MTNLLSPTVNGVLPSFFADFTTEGTTNHYYASGAIQANFAAWASALSITFTRANPPASFINSSGLLAFANANIPRFDYDPVALTPKGLLHEGTSTNLALQSNTFSNASWTLGTDISLAQNATGPDGVLNSAWTWTDDAVVQNHWLAQSISYTSGTTYTFSVHVKYTNHQYVGLRQFDSSVFPWATFDLLNGLVTNTQSGVTATITKLANGWFRITHTLTATATGSGNIILSFANSSSYNGGTYAGTGTDTFLAFGAQMEALSFSSSYIPTTTSTVTRAADSAPGSSAPWFNSANWTMYASGDDASVPSNGNGLWGFSDGSTNNLADLRASGSGLLATVQTGGSLVFQPQTTDSGQSGYSANVSAQSAISFGSGNFIYVKNGGSADTVSASGPTGINHFSLGAVDDGADILPLYGHLQQVGFWPATGTSTQLQSLTGNPIVWTVQNVNTTSTQNLNLPINCVIAGSQPEETIRKFSVDMFGILKRIFRE